MPRVKLGTQGLEVSKLGYGCMGLTWSYTDPVLEDVGISIITEAFKRGVTFFDTSDFYGPKTNEILVGNYYYPRFTEENLEKNKILYSRIEKLAEKHRCSPAQLALSWVLHQGNDVVPIPGTTRVKNLESNIRSVRVNLNEEDLNEISDVVPIHDIAGDRALESNLRSSWKFANTSRRDI